MSKRKEQMIRKARKQLDKNEIPQEENIAEEPKKAPSFIASYFILFAGVSLLTFTYGTPYFGPAIFLGLPLVAIGMYRSFKAAVASSRKRTL